MNAATLSSRPSPVVRALASALSVAIALSPLRAAAAPLALVAPAPAAAPTAPGSVGLMRFTGDPTAAENLRSQIQADVSQAGFTVKGVALDIDAAAGKVKCKGGPDACVGKVAEWLQKGAKAGTTYSYLIYGTVPAEPGAAGSVVIYDVAKQAKVKEFTPTAVPDDLIQSLALPRAMVAALQGYGQAAPAATPEEQKLIAELDEPAKTPEELRAEADAIRKAQEGIADGQGEMVDVDVVVDLRKDFKDFCRTGPAKPRVNKDDPKDLRPVCKRGPVFGYWQTRAWVALGLTAGALVTAGIFYSLGLAARGPYKDSLAALNNSGLSNEVPTEAAMYTTLASDVADKGNTMRNRLIGGDVALLTTVLLAGVLGIIIYQDRTDAKEFIKTEKQLRAVSKIQNFRGGPILSTTVQGFGFGFNF